MSELKNALSSVLDQGLGSDSVVWLGLVAFMWLLNVVFLVFATRRYFALKSARSSGSDDGPESRDHYVAVDESEEAAASGREEAPTARGMPEPLPVMVEQFRATIAEVVETPRPVEIADAVETADGSTVADRLDAAAPAEVAAATAEPPDVLLAAVARIAQDPASGQPLGDLIRALYLDQSVFTFDGLAAIDARDREMAAALITAWLMATYDTDRWEAAFETTQALRGADRTHGIPRF